MARPVGGRIAGWDVYGPGDLIATPWGDLDPDALYDQVNDEVTTSP